MEYAKDEVFQIRYTTKLNRFKLEKEKWTSRLGKKIRKNRLLTTTILAFFMFATVHIMLIFSFMKILQEV
ncbi:MAG: hypothetical protein HFJ33_07560 [Clostridia bacterium]|nr:hypothetical protein [Clostridia bacterium]